MIYEASKTLLDPITEAGKDIVGDFIIEENNKSTTKVTRVRAAKIFNFAPEKDIMVSIDGRIPIRLRGGKPSCLENIKSFIPQTSGINYDFWAEYD